MSEPGRRYDPLTPLARELKEVGLNDEEVSYITGAPIHTVSRIRRPREGFRYQKS